MAPLRENEKYSSEGEPRNETRPQGIRGGVSMTAYLRMSLTLADYPLEAVPVCEWSVDQVSKSRHFPSGRVGTTPIHGAEWEWE